MKQSHSLQSRLLVLVLGTVVVLWLAVAAVTWRDAQHELDELLDSHLAQAAALLVARQAAHVEEDDRLVDAPTLHPYAPTVAFQVWHEGVLAMRSGNAPADRLSSRASGFETRDIGDIGWRVFAARGAEGDIQVYVGEQVSSRGQILRAVMRSLLWPMLIGLPLLGLAGWWAVRRGLAPLRRLSHQIEERDAQALEPVTLAGAPAELAPLLAALNHLFDRIAALLASERRFTADAAHELRTPIAAIRAQAQVSLGARSTEEREHALRATLQGCDRAARVVDQLLTLARLEVLPAGAASRVDLSEVARQVVADLAPLALDKKQTIELEAPAECAVQGDGTLLGVLVRNLVDNAVRYSPVAAKVHVSVGREAGDVCLSVEDSGPGLAAQTRQRLGERFFRALGSGESGSGLGWSIVNRIAAAHGARVDLGDSPLLGGLAVVLRWGH